VAHQEEEVIYLAEGFTKKKREKMTPPALKPNPRFGGVLIPFGTKKYKAAGCRMPGSFL
jgi:hypothetical protein